MSDPDPLDEAFDRLETHLPGKVCRAFHWLRGPRAKWVRIPVGVVFLLGGLLWFLPLLGLWMFPVGLMLLAEDLPFLRRPVGRMALWLIDRWERYKARRRVNAG